MVLPVPGEDVPIGSMGSFPSTGMLRWTRRGEGHDLPPYVREGGKGEKEGGGPTHPARATPRHGGSRTRRITPTRTGALVDARRGRDPKPSDFPTGGSKKMGVLRRSSSAILCVHGRHLRPLSGGIRSHLFPSTNTADPTPPSQTHLRSGNGPWHPGWIFSCIPMSVHRASRSPRPRRGSPDPARSLLVARCPDPPTDSSISLL